MEKHAPALALTALLLSALALAAGAGAAAAQEAASFEWNMPSRYSGVVDARGKLFETQPYEVRRGPWTVYLRVTGRACTPGARYRWRVLGEPKRRPQRIGPCRFSLRLPAEGPYRVRLDARLGGAHLRPVRQRIVVRDWLIVAIGDSVASGEGVPEAFSFGARAPWQSARCHRSGRAGVARAARQIEADDGHSSVTFVHVACSGAEVETGLLGPYAGAVPPRDEPALEPQVPILNRLARKRKVDAVLLSIGANDVNFSGIAAFCAAAPSHDCFARALPRDFGGDGATSVRQAVIDDLAALRRSYRRLAARISGRIPSSRIYISEYFDPTHNATGASCETLFGAIDANEVEQARTRILAPLNRAVATAASQNHWHLVDGIAASFGRHGYCAGRQAWVNTLGDSLRNLGGIAGRHRGTLHPNSSGHEVIGTLLAAELEHDLYPNRSFPPRPFPQPAMDEDDGIALGVVVLIVLAVILLWPAIVLLLPGALAIWLLWLGRDSVTPLILGLAAGVLLLVALRHWRPASSMLKSEPVRKRVGPLLSLAKTVRPLLLPLLIVIAVGAANLPLVVQVLLGAVLVVLAWRLIIAPEAAKSGVSWELPLLKKVGLHSVIALAVGAAVIFVVRRIDFATSPYFKTIGDFASGLLLVALLLWVGAVAMRLFSFATTWLRAALALDIGALLVVLAMAFGLVPGIDAVEDAWQPVAAALGGLALLLLAIELARNALAGAAGAGAEPEPGAGAGQAQGAGRPFTSRVAGAGFSAAAVAAVVLAVSAGYGLVDADSKGEPLEPPDEEVVDARPLPAPETGEWGLELARRFAPVLAFTADEHWGPERVDRYVDAATLSGPGVGPKLKSVSELPQQCPESGSSLCYRLSIECDRTGHELCRGRLRTAGRLYRDGAVYVRVLNKTGADGSRRLRTFIPRGPFREELETLIQYWYFYPYNEWRAPVFAGLLVQRHESDWEAVTIGFNGNNRPLFVADSAHCAGSWRPWRRVEASRRVPGPHTHPLVAAANGSHANYPSASEKRSPDWASCAGALPAGVATGISYASNIRDRTEYGWLWYPPANGWIRASARRPPMSFPGRWGADGDIILHNFRTNVLTDAEAAPATPSRQPLWREPVKTIFCGRYEPHRCDAAQ